jgi:hypothetical protein
MNQDKLNPYLRKEDALNSRCIELQEHLDRLEAQFRQIEQSLGFWGRALPFMQRKRKASKALLSAELTHARTACAKAQKELEDFFPLVQEAAREWLEACKDPGYLRSFTINGFYAGARQRIRKFRDTVQAFLKSIGEARGAMSSGYNQEKQAYSIHAEDRIKDALRVAVEVDRVVEDIARLNEQFATKARGSIYASITLPTFGRAQYEGKVRRIAKEPIGTAQLAFEKLLKECEKLHDEGIDEAYEILRQAEEDHIEVSDRYVTQAWRREQAKILAKKTLSYVV